MAIGAPSARGSEPGGILQLLDEMDSSYSTVKDYVGVLNSQERVDGKLGARQTALFKFQRPLKIYMKFTDGPSKVVDALYVKGSHGNKLLVRRRWALGLLTLSLDPKGWMAMSGNRHPITELGFGFLLAEFRRNIEQAIRLGEHEILQLTDETYNGRPATRVEGRFFPQGGRKYYCSRYIIHIDKILNLPVGNTFFDAKDEVFEDYVFKNIKLNVGLTAADFSLNQ